MEKAWQYSVMTFDQKIEIAKFVSGLLIPGVLLVFGYLINRKLREVESIIQNQNRVSDNRIELYKDIGFKINDLYVYFNLKSYWKSVTYKNVVDTKRDLDKFFHTYRPVFGEKVFEKYKIFMDDLFETSFAVGVDARLRTNVDHRPEASNDNAQDRFTGEDNVEQINHSYRELMDCLAKELGLKLKNGN